MPRIVNGLLMNPFRCAIGFLIIFGALLHLVGCQERTSDVQTVQTEAIRVLRSALENEGNSEKQRDVAAIALWDLVPGDAEARSRLAQILEDASRPPQARIQVAVALGEQGEEHAKLFVQEQLGSQSMEILAYAAVACARLKVKDAGQRIVELVEPILSRPTPLAQNDAELWLAWAAASLGNMEATLVLWETLYFYMPHLVPDLSQLEMQVERYPLWVSAAEKIQRLGGDTFLVLDKALEPVSGGGEPHIMTEDYVAAAVQAAVALADTNYREGAERIRAFLDSLTAEERDYERWQLAGALLQLGDDSRSDHLLNDLRGSDEKRRFRAAVAASTRLRKQWYDPHPREWWGEAGKLIPSPQTAVTAFKDCADCPEMVVLPGRTFLMGSAETEAERHDSEGPQHKVTLKPFAIGKYEVTFAEWDACVKDGGCNGYRPADNGWGRGRRPVINVSWFDAQAYVEWLAKATRKPYRLPSEAEWEYAARAGTTTRFSVGDDITPKAANYSESKLGKTTEVGVYPKNPWGLYDMHGNVWELVEDIWHNNYEGAPADGSAWTDGEEKTSRRSRVNRGGSWVAFPSWFVPWLNSPRFLRSAFRGSYAPGIRIDDCGFRVARTLDSGQADSFSSSRDRSTATPLRLEPVR